MVWCVSLHDTPILLSGTKHKLSPYPSNLEVTQAFVRVWHNILTPYSSWRANLSLHSGRSLKFLKAANIGNTKLKYLSRVPLGLKTKYVCLLSRNTNKMQLCNRIYYSKAYWRLNMFRAAHRSSSGALNCIWRLCIIYTKFFTLLQYVSQRLQIQFGAPGDERHTAHHQEL